MRGNVQYARSVAFKIKWISSHRIFWTEKSTIVNIFIDESGSFVSTSSEGYWSAVAAFALPEAARKGLELAISELKTIPNRIGKYEKKINELNEPEYVDFLEKLARLNGALFCIATDAGLNTPASIVMHQKSQVEKVLVNIDKMKFEGGRKGVALLAAQIEKLSPQLYVQLFCQVELMYEVVSRAINYYVQHNPGTLSEIRWRIDQKDTVRTNFEDTFEILTLGLLQTMSLSKPFLMVKEFDYSRMKQYEFAPGKTPTFLKDDYGIELNAGGQWNLQKLIRGNIKFMDSRESAGIQAVDLIVSGIRKCLRHGFKNNERIAVLLGRLMIEAIHNEPPLRMISFGVETTLDQDTAHLVNLMWKNAKPMLKN